MRWRSLLGWAVVTALVVAAMRSLSWRAVLDGAAGAHPGWLLVGVAANAVVLLLATGQWLLFLPRGVRLPPGRMFSIVALSASVSNGGPPLAGHAAAIHFLATRGGLGHAGGTSVFLLDQVAEGAAKWLLVVAAAATVPGFAYRTVGLTVLAGVPALAGAALLLAHRGHLLEGVERRWGSGLGKVAGFVSRASSHLDALRRPRRIAGGVGVAVLQKVAEGAALAAVAYALGTPLPAWVVLAALAAVSLSTLVALTPANLGVWEGAAFLVYRSAGMDAEAALALAVLQHAAYLIPHAGAGWAVLTLEATRKRAPRPGPTPPADRGA